MNITVHHTGSSGNLVQIDDLLIDPGLSIGKIKEALLFRLSSIRACLLSHAHMDHARGAKGVMKAGIPLYCSKETAEARGLSGHRLHLVEHREPVIIGPWRVTPFDLVHDVRNLGFGIAKDGEAALYVTDSNYVHPQFPAVDYVLLGVDYDAEILKRNIAADHVHQVVGKRILKNHMSLKTALGFLGALDRSRLREIHIMHLSDTNSDEAKFRDEIMRATGRPVYIH